MTRCPHGHFLAGRIPCARCRPVEHAAWLGEEARARKERIGREVARLFNAAFNGVVGGKVGQ